MAQPTLEDWEVSLIKAMLQRGFPNKTIQFYFNRPDRSVNSGRISEIKGGARWTDIAPASEHDLDDFLDHHPYAEPYRPDGEPEMPRQREAASNFRIDNEGRIDLEPESVADSYTSDPMASEAYDELRDKVGALVALGANHIAQVEQKATALLAAMPEDATQASVLRMWSRGNSLRRDLQAHESASQLDEYHPAKLDPSCASHLADVVDAFNLLAALIPKLAEFDQAKLGPDGADLRQAVDDVGELIPEMVEIATPDAAFELEFEKELLKEEGDGPEAERQRNVLGGTLYNFLLTSVKGVYREVRKTTGLVLGDYGDQVRVAIGSLVTVEVGKFILSRFPEIQAFFAQIAANPVASQLLEFLKTLFT